MWPPAVCEAEGPEAKLAPLSGGLPRTHSTSRLPDEKPRFSGLGWTGPDTNLRFQLSGIHTNQKNKSERERKGDGKEDRRVAGSDGPYDCQRSSVAFASSIVGLCTLLHDIRPLPSHSYETATRSRSTCFRRLAQEQALPPPLSLCLRLFALLALSILAC